MSRTPRRSAAAVGVALLVGLLTALPARADLSPVLWDGGGASGATSDPANWAGDALPTIAGEDTLVFPAVTDRTVDFDLVVEGGADEDAQALLEALVFEAADYLVLPVAAPDLSFLPPHLYGDLDLRAEDDGRQLILAEAAGRIDLDLPIVLDPQEVPGHVTAADPAGEISCLPVAPLPPFVTCYFVQSGEVVLDGPGHHRLLGDVLGEGDVAVRVRDGRTTVAGAALQVGATIVEAGGTLRLGEPGVVDDASGVVNGFLVVGDGGRLEGNGQLAECECVGFVLIGTDDEVEGLGLPGPGTLAPGFDDGSEAERVGVYSTAETLLGREATYEVDWLRDGGDSACDRLDTNFLTLERVGGDGPVLDLDLPDEDLPAGASCTIVDVYDGVDEQGQPVCEAGSFDAPDGTELAQLDDGDGILELPSPASRNGVEVVQVDYCSGEDERDVTLRVLPNVRWTVDDGAEGVADPVGTGFALSDTVQDLGEAGEDDDVLVVHLDITGGDATAGADYTGAAGDRAVGPAVLADGFSQLVVDDDDEEPTERIEFAWTIDYPATWTAGEYWEVGPSELSGAIEDDDEVSASVADVAVQEAAGTATVTIALSGPSFVDHTYVVSTADLTAVAPGDYAARTGVEVTIPAGETTATVVLGIVGDALDEVDEAFLVTVVESEVPCEGEGCTEVEAAAVLADGQAVVTILDDDPAAAQLTTTTTSTPASTTTTVRVGSSTATPLPRTGSSPLPSVTVGALLVACGALLTRRAAKVE